MNCIVCGREVSSSKCAHCQFPVYEIVGDNVEESAAQINAYAKIHRENYLNDLLIGIVTYKWKEENGKFVEESHIPLYFAKGCDLKKGEVWCSENFARIPDLAVLTVTLAIKKGDLLSQVDVQISNLMEQELQKIGIRLDDMLQVRILLKNDSGLSESQPISVAIGG